MSDYKIKVGVELDLTSLKAQLESTKFNIDGTSATKGGKQVVSALGNIDTATKKTTKFWDTTMGKIVKFGYLTDVVRGVGSAVMSVGTNVANLDAKMTEFKKVSDLSGEALENWKNKAYDVGTEVARTGTEVIEAATNFKKMGYSEEDSLQLSKVATMFQNIADTEVSAADAADFINSQMKAFNITASDSEHIIDAVNEVANNFAVGSNDLSSALTVAGSSLATTGNSFEQTIG